MNQYLKCSFLNIGLFTETGNKQFYALNNDLLMEWKELILYHLVVLEQKYPVPLPALLKDYLVSALKS